MNDEPRQATLAECNAQFFASERAQAEPEIQEPKRTRKTKGEAATEQPADAE